MNSTSSLLQRRSALDSQWNRFVSGSAPAMQTNVRDDIMSSWQRSAQFIKPQQGSAPADDEYAVKHRWQNSLIRQAADREQA